MVVAYSHLMSRRFLLNVLLLASGCTTHTHSKYTLAHDIGTPLVVAPLELVVEVDALKIGVTATRACRAPASDVVVDTLHVNASNANAGTSNTPSSGVPALPNQNQQENDAGAALFGLVGALIGAADVVANDGKVTVKRERRPDEDALCPASVRQIVVEVDLPSGLKLTGRTDDTGLVELFIPDSEPASGALTIRAPGMQPRTASYTRPTPSPAE